MSWLIRFLFLVGSYVGCGVRRPDSTSNMRSEPEQDSHGPVSGCEVGRNEGRVQLVSDK